MVGLVGLEPNASPSWVLCSVSVSKRPSCSGAAPRLGMRSRAAAQGSHSLRLRPQVESDGTLADFSAIGRPFFGCLTEVIPYEHARICVLGRRL